MDLVKASLVVNFIALAIAAATAMIIAIQNAGSRNLALATGTLIAAIVLFALQVCFELQASTAYDHVSTTFTVDRGAPLVRQWVYPKSSGWRMSAETGASSWLAANNPAALRADSGPLVTDLAVFSLVSFLGAEEFDWQLRKTVYQGKSAGDLVEAAPVSSDHDCTYVTKQDLVDKLKSAGNAFAGAHLLVAGGRLCLPPGSGVDISRESVVLRNPAFRISFSMSPALSVSNMRPDTGGDVPVLADGTTPQFETRWVGIKIETVFFALRSQQRASPKYKEWVTRVITGLRVWYEA